MKLLRVILTLALITTLGSVAYVAQQAESASAKMTKAATAFLSSLKPEQKNKAFFAFDSKERTNWNFVPLQNVKEKKSLRKGLGLMEMTPKQRKLALDLLAAGTSKTGNHKANLIMALESILNDLEKGRGPIRDPQWYFLTIFGEPSRTGEWGWRFEGHHLSLNFTMSGGEVISASPAFFGANPAIVKKGPKVGLEALPDCENISRELFLSLNPTQKKVASRKNDYPEPEQGSVAPKVGEPEGLAVAHMSEEQKKLMRRLIQGYAGRMPKEIAQEEMALVRKGGFEKIHFSYSGTGEPGNPHTYRVQGPTFVIEFLNTQSDPLGNMANHIHSVWRRIEGDFGIQKKS